MKYPVYLEKFENGYLDSLIETLEKELESCTLCPKNCRVNRNTGVTGYCKQQKDPRVANVVLHFGEEPPLVGDRGAGAVFFSGCSMSCVYCQNFGFSQNNTGMDLTFEGLGEVFLNIQEEGAETLDLVTPTPNLPGILKALKYAVERGFELPIVYNTSGYEKVETLRMLEGIVDIYLTDIRYCDDEMGKIYSKVPDYWSVTKKAVKEMFRQVGAFKEVDGMKRGVIIRHLVLPNGIAGTEEMAEFVAFELSLSVPISLMSQYRPVYKAKKCPEISRRISVEEYEIALDILETYGLNGWMQHFESKEPFRAKPLGRRV